LRVKLLVNFIEKGLNLKLKKIYNISYLGINEYLINYQDKKKNWPQEDIISYKYKNGYSSLFANFETYSIVYSKINNKKEWFIKGSNDKNHNKCEETIPNVILSNLFPLVEY